MIFFTYFISFLVALFLEYPFRTMAKVVFSPPKKILRLNRELARELNTNIDNLFNDSDDDLDNTTVRDSTNNNNLQANLDQRELRSNSNNT